MSAGSIYFPGLGQDNSLTAGVILSVTASATITAIQQLTGSPNVQLTTSGILNKELLLVGSPSVAVTSQGNLDKLKELEGFGNISVVASSLISQLRFVGYDPGISTTRQVTVSTATPSNSYGENGDLWIRVI